VHHDGVRVTPPPDPGLCAACVHARIIAGARSSFIRCGLADSDPGFPRYPSLPVHSCAGFTRVAPHSTEPRNDS